MGDDDLFHELMKSLGVEPLGESPSRGSTSEDRADKRGEAEKQAKTPGARAARRRLRKAAAAVPEVAADDEDGLFLEAMQNLGTLPDKDRGAPAASGRPRRLRKPTSRRVEPDATLDLHGQTTEEALASLRSFVTSCAREGLRTVIVVTGKGLRSERGFSILKEEVGRWLRVRGKTWVRAFSEAPRSLGGRGAYVLHLR